eukprot:TRINITY_DN4572_c0_g2_i1.p1 TRINITY_DN4572_c0_g2~~TRINITY_DN4572_c0_g2_i1.p1  ORF type:complete len:289 (+),score=28.48 TRINITY_DN4572_c0_g2_i1:2-868(+)
MIIHGIDMKKYIPDSDLEFINIIGEGAYGKVWFGKWCGKDVAIKEYCRKRADGDENDNKVSSDFIKELEILGSLNHPNVLTYLGFSVNQNRCFMVSEFADNGSLYEHLHKKATKFTHSQIFDICKQIANGMAYLHDNHILHCDLKSSNILLTTDLRVKLCDFGLSRLKSSLTKVNKGRIGTPHWMSPCILREEGFDETADVYSYGMVVWETITGRVPYEGLSVMQIVGAVGYGTYRVEMPTQGNQSLIEMMKKCLSREKNDRPSFREIIEFLDYTLKVNGVVGLFKKP